MADDERMLRLEHAVFGNGNPGIMQNMTKIYTRLESLIATIETRERERKGFEEERRREERSSARKINMLLTVMLIVLGIVSAYLSYHESRYHSLLSQPTVSASPQAVVANLERNLYVSH